MSDTLATEAVPLVSGAEGQIWVEGTRVPLDTVVQAFERGATAEEIAQEFPTVSLAVAYQVIGYYLRHKSDLESYFSEREKRYLEVRAANYQRWPSDGLRDRLLARGQK